MLVLVGMSVAVFAVSVEVAVAAVAAVAIVVAIGVVAAVAVVAAAPSLVVEAVLGVMILEWWV
jgi:hypothetical protein